MRELKFLFVMLLALGLVACGSGGGGGESDNNVTPTPNVESRSSIEGAVKDAVTFDPIYGVLVSLFDEAGNRVFQVLTDESGNYIFRNVTPGNYTISFEKEGYIPARGFVEVPANSTVVFPTLLQIDVEHSGNGTLRGLVKDATNGRPVPEVSMVVYHGIGNDNGELVIRTVSDSNGNYEIEAKAGYYTICLMKDGYEQVCYPISLIGGEDTIRDFVITPVLGENELRIVLTWGETPSDLDAHLVKIKDGRVEYHLYWYYAESCPDHGNCHGSPTEEAILDVDDITSFGPETITIFNLDTNATYRYYVHDYSTFSGSESMALANSGATVKVYWGNKTYTFNVPNLPGTAWKVFEIVNGTLVQCIGSDCVFGVEGHNDPQIGSRSEAIFFNKEK